MMVMMLESSRSFGTYLIAACQDSVPLASATSLDPPLEFFSTATKSCWKYKLELFPSNHQTRPHDGAGLVHSLQ